MCPKCGEFIEACENSHVIICHKCGTLHTLSHDSNKAQDSKNFYLCKKRPDYTPRYNLKYSLRLSDGKIGAISSYKLYLAQLRIFQTACRVMNRGLYAQALDFFAIIPNFEGVSAKVQECRKHLERKQAVQKTKTVPEQKHENDFYVFLGAVFHVLAIWIFCKILEALFS